MIRRLLLLATLGIAVAGASSMAWSIRPRTAEALTNCDTSTAALDASELEIVTLFNQARAQQGLAPLKVSPALSRAAAWKSADPSATGSGGYAFSHTDSLGRLPSARARDCGYPGGAGENIAWGFGSAQSVFNAWMNSPGHRAAILGNYQVVGIGRVGSAWTAKFGTVDDSGSGGTAPAATPTATKPAATTTAGQSYPTASPTATATNTAPTATPTVSPTAVPTPPPIQRRAAVPMIAAE
jgi:uncharacterized protein YkwD